VVADLDYFAERLGEERWDRMPRSNKWSFAQNLWHLLKEARRISTEEVTPILMLHDRGKECVGKAAEILRLFEEDEAEEAKPFP
jgi:hypothetical protein